MKAISLERNLFQRIYAVLKQQIGGKYEAVKVRVVSAFDSDGCESFKKTCGGADSETGVLE